MNVCILAACTLLCLAKVGISNNTSQYHLEGKIYRNLHEMYKDTKIRVSKLKIQLVQ